MSLGLLPMLQGIVTVEQRIIEIGSLARQKDGLLVWDDFDRADSADVGTAVSGGLWTEYQHADDAWSISSNLCRINSDPSAPNRNAWCVQTTITSDEDFIVQTMFKMDHPGESLGLVARGNGLTSPIGPSGSGYLLIPGGFWSLRHLPSFTLLVEGGARPPASSDKWQLVRIVGQNTGSNLKLSNYFLTSSDFPDENDLTTDPRSDWEFTHSGSGVYDSGTIALRGYDHSGNFNNSFFCGRTIKVVGLSGGFQARIVGPTFTRSAVIEAGDGTSSIDVDGYALPADRIEVLDQSGFVVATIDSASGIWGGDEFKYTPFP